ncbi:MAG TPA: dicarboxylate/amino acid:cation symporter [Gammaproteobacteria bacterium]|nr:dicarboxylate/amino acid:cation symporter [Gammaproteobacteria bacterium]
MRNLALHWQILIALALATIAGMLTGTDTEIFGVNFLSIYEFIGTLFINALKMLIVPLVASAMINSINNIGSASGFGRLSSRTLFYYAITMVTAVLIGLVFFNLIQPGLSDGMPIGDQLGLDARAAEVAANVKGGVGENLASVFLSIIPENIFVAAVNADMLALIFFSLVFGYFMSQVKNLPGETLRAFWEGVFDVMMRITIWIMKFAPIGVFGLVAAVVAETGLAAVVPMLVFAATVLLALAFHMFVTLPAMLYFLGRVNPLTYYRAVAPALLTAFSTASSNGTLPINIQCLEENVGVSKKVSNFVLPLGATINMDGTAIYECVAALFLIQAFGVDLSFTTQFVVAVMALLTAVGVAGVPAASLVAITIIITAVGLPAEAIGVLFVTDRILDMCRTSVNVMGDGVAGTVVARFEGEKFKVGLGDHKAAEATE